jgi:hypothetical protein
MSFEMAPFDGGPQAGSAGPTAWWECPVGNALRLSSAAAVYQAGKRLEGSFDASPSTRICDSCQDFTLTVDHSRIEHRMS